MKKVRAAIDAYGNIGHYVLEALQAAPDFEIAGVVRRAGAENCPAELSAYPVVKNIKELKGVDVAILCTPTRKVEEYPCFRHSYCGQFRYPYGYHCLAPHTGCRG